MEKKNTIAFYASKVSCENHIHYSKGLLQPIISRVADMYVHGVPNAHVKTKNYTTPYRMQRLASEQSGPAFESQAGTEFSA
jgi:hypothetical protein